MKHYSMQDKLKKLESVDQLKEMLEEISASSNLWVTT